MRASDPLPLCLLPGLMCDERIWAPQVAALGAGRPVLVGRYGDARSMTTMAERVLAVAPPRFALAGHSMGGRVALEMLRLEAQRVERLALLDTGVHPLAPGETEKRRALLDLGRREGMRALVDAWLPPMVHADLRNESFLRPLREMCLDAGLAGYENQMTALLERPDARPLLGTIRCPTLVAVGRDDVWAPLDQHRAIAESIRGATLVVFERAGHMAPVEAPEQVTRALQAWLDTPAEKAG